MASPDSALRATYTSPNDSAAFTRDIPSTGSAPTTEEKTAYLSVLRKSVIELQAEVNAFVTQKMEEDNKVAGVDESKEAALEENYGEEIVEEE